MTAGEFRKELERLSGLPNPTLGDLEKAFWAAMRAAWEEGAKAGETYGEGEALYQQDIAEHGRSWMTRPERPTNPYGPRDDRG